MPLDLPPPLLAKLKKASESYEEFWAEAADELHWFKKWDKVYEARGDSFRWFIGGYTNISYNCLDYNVFKSNRGNRAALIWESERDERRVLTYNQLLYEVRRFAAALRSLGVGKGETVTIYMPMVPESIVAMLACTRIGAVHSVVFAGFGAKALADRINDAESKVVITSDVGYRRGAPIRLKETVDEALKSSSTVNRVVVLKRGDREPSMSRPRDLYWDEAIEMGKGFSDHAVSMEANEPCFILYTSGTTGKPKGVVHVHGGYQVYVHAMAKWIFSMNEYDTWWSTSDIGWIVGHSYIVYAPLLIGCTTLLFEGALDYPRPDTVWRIIERDRVSKVFTSPTAIRSLMKYGDEWPKKYDLSSLQLVVSAGEVLNPAAWEWLQRRVLEDRVAVIDHMWQTETGGPIVGNPYGICTLPIKPGSACIPVPGVEVEVVDGEGRPLPPNTQGILVVKKPFPGLTQTLWRDHERYLREYWRRIPNYYYTGDAAMKDDDGYIWFVGRFDEVIKIAAHRIGTIEVENALLTHPAVAEAAVIGKPDEVRGEVAMAFVVLKGGYEYDEGLKRELKEVIRSKMGPVVVVDDIIFVDKLPKTRSGKIMRRLIKAIITNQPLGDYSTIEDEASIEEVERAAKELRKVL